MRECNESNCLIRRPHVHYDDGVVLKKRKTWDEISRQVGYPQGYLRGISIPSLEEVQNCNDVLQLLRWDRFCEGADTPDECRAYDAITKKVDRMRKDIETKCK